LYTSGAQRVRVYGSRRTTISQGINGNIPAFGLGGTFVDFLSNDGIADLLIVEGETADHNFKWFASMLESVGLLESSIENARIELAQKTATLLIAE
jgi:hypothetical protein